MPVHAMEEYVGIPADAVENYHGSQLLYVGWDNHLMFCAPASFALPPDTKFRHVVETLLAETFSYHPDWQNVNLAELQWTKAGESWEPDLDKTLAELGLVHKQLVRFVTPGLNGIAGSSY